MGTISRQTTWSTGDTLTASDINGEFDNILSTANGSLNADNLGVTAGQAAASKAIVLDSNKDFADTSSSNQIRNLTISGSLKIGTTFLPDASGGADLGSTALEWGDVYIADDKKIYLGSDQDISLQYDETTNNALEIAAAVEGAALGIVLKSDQGDDAGDEWKLNIADGGTLTLGNDIASAGTYVTHLTLTPNSTVSSSTLALAGALTVAGTASITGVATVGGITIGSAVINEAELETIDGITAGTVAASKAVVVDSNKDIGTFRNVTIDGTFSDGNYTFDTSGNVSGLGTIGSGAITSTGVVTATGFTIGSAVINEAELETIDGVTAGTVAASKAVVVDSNKDIGSFRNVTLTGELDAATLDISGNADIDGTTNLDAVDIDGAVQVDATITVGADDQGYDVIFYGDTASANLTWDTSADDLILNGGAGLIVPDGQLTLGSTALAATAAELNVLDGVTAGTVAASKGVVVDANKDIGSFRNVTLTGELDAATLDISGNADIDGTTNLDVVDIDGAVQVDATITVGVDDTGYDVKFFGATSGSSLLWDESADDLILTNAGLAVGSDATGDIYYRDANGFLARLAIGSDGQVLTSTGTVVNWEAAGGGGGGDFSGPGSATDNAVVRFNGTGGKTGQNSGVTIDDSNNATGFANLTLTGELQTANIGYTDGDNAITIADGGGVTFPQAATFTSGFSNNDQNITNVGDIAVDTISGDNDSNTTIGFPGSDVLTLNTGGSERMRIDSSGRVGIGNAAISSYTGDTSTLAVGDTGDAGASIRIAGTTSSTQRYAFTDTADTTDQAYVSYDHNSGKLYIATNDSGGHIVFKHSTGTDLMQIGDASDNGRVGIGETSPNSILHVKGAANANEGTIQLESTDNDTSSVGFFNRASSAAANSRRWLVGVNLDADGDLNFRRSTSATGDPTTVAMTINKDGEVGIGMAPGNMFDVLSTTGNQFSSMIKNSNGTNPQGLYILHSAATESGTTYPFIQCSNASEPKFYVYTNGDVQSRTNSYAGISDLKIKQDITDARSYWDDFKSVRFRKFRFKQDVELDADAGYMFGVVSQELEPIFPSLVYETPDKEHQDVPVLDEDGNATYEQTEKLDEDGNVEADDDGNIILVDKLDDDGNKIAITEDKMVDLGTTTKGVKYSILSQIGLKVVQELQARLEAAEAKIAALEAA